MEPQQPHDMPVSTILQKIQSFADNTSVCRIKRLVISLYAGSIHETHDLNCKLSLLKQLLPIVLYHVEILSQQASNTYFCDELTQLHDILRTLESQNLQDIIRTLEDRRMHEIANHSVKLPADEPAPHSNISAFTTLAASEALLMTECYHAVVNTCRSNISSLNSQQQQSAQIADSWNKFVQETNQTCIKYYSAITKDTISRTSPTIQSFDSRESLEHWVAHHFHRVKKEDCENLIKRIKAKDKFSSEMPPITITEQEKKIFGPDPKHVHTSRLVISHLHTLLPPNRHDGQRTSEQKPYVPSSVVLALHDTLCSKSSIRGFRDLLTTLCTNLNIPSFQAVSNYRSKCLRMENPPPENVSHMEEIQELYNHFLNNSPTSCQPKVENLYVDPDSMATFFYAPEPDMSTQC